MNTTEMKTEFLRQQNKLCDKIEPIDKSDVYSVKLICISFQGDRVPLRKQV